MEPDQPNFSSLALRAIPRPDYANVTIVPMPPGLNPDPAQVAELMFSPKQAPLAIRMALLVREHVYDLLDREMPPGRMFSVDQTEGSEALIHEVDADMNLAIAVASDSQAGLLRVTTAVKFNSVKGRLSFIPLRYLHAPVSNTMARRSVRTLARRQRRALPKSGRKNLPRRPS